MKTCSIENCKEKHYGLGFCQKHYMRFKRHGDPLFTKIEMHGMHRTTEYSIWESMKERCCNSNKETYKNYGGRGITVCDRWKNSFKAFYEDMGPRPFPKAQLDRIDNDGNYEPGNLHWVTSAENHQNKRNNVVNWFTVRSIRRLYAMHKYSQVRLSKIYNVHCKTISNITLNKTWKEAMI